MLKKVTLLASVAVAAFTMNGCSSYPETAEDLAKKTCTIMKSGQFEDLTEYIAPSMKEEFLRDVKKAMSDEKKMAQIKEKMAKLDCSTITKTKDYDDGRKKLYFGRVLKVKVKQIDGKWQVVDL